MRSRRAILRPCKLLLQLKILSGDWRDSNGGEIQIVQSGNQIVATGKNEAVTRWWDRAPRLSMANQLR